MASDWLFLCGNETPVFDSKAPSWKQKARYKGRGQLCSFIKCERKRGQEACFGGHLVEIKKREEEVSDCLGWTVRKVRDLVTRD